MYRVLKPGGHFSISDIVLDGTLPPQIQQAAEIYAGCASGTGILSVTVYGEKPNNIIT
jgi:hypothetical protein